MQFLNLTRSSQNRISTATDVFSHVNTSTSAKNQNDNGSNSEVTVNTNNDFWSELENNLKIILQEGEPKATYSLNKQAGLISICGNSKHHILVKEYIKKLTAISSSQVLIEAKIIEVVLKDQFRSGINWQKIGTRNDLQVNAPFGDMSRSHFLDPNSAQNEMISFGATGKTFSAIIKALEEFGAVRTLSSPRLTVMNNQTAILKVAQNQVYFRLNYDKQYNNSANRESVSVSSDIQTVPIGLVMLVQPSIDRQGSKIILFLRPTISRLSKSVADPAVNIVYNSSINASNADNSKLASAKPSLIPVIEVREIDSILQLLNGELAVLGGLMEVRSVQHDVKAPGLGDIPILKELFSSHAEGDEVVELVILLRAIILPSGQAPKPNTSDQRLVDQYKTKGGQSFHFFSFGFLPLSLQHPINQEKKFHPSGSFFSWIISSTRRSGITSRYSVASVSKDSL